MSLEDKASIVLPKGFAGKAGTLECWNPNSDTLVGLSVVRATNAWRINEAGAWEVSASNVPRRDFLNGGCGELLVEPQRTNLFLNSATGATQSITVASGSAYSVSFSGTGSITFSGGHTGTLSGTGAAVTDRVSTTFTTLTTSVTCTILGTVEYVNFELGSYATSWIETSGAAVTRNADVISGTGLAALLGQSAGGFYAEIILSTTETQGLISISNNSTFTGEVSLNSVSGAFRLQAGYGSINVVATGTTDTTTSFKIAARYQDLNFAFGLNGVLSTNTSFNFPASVELNTVRLNGSSAAGSFKGYRIKEFVIFKTPPTDGQITAITTP